MRASQRFAGNPMLMKIGRVIAWLLIGITTSIAIVWAAGAYVAVQVPVKPSGGGTVYTDAWDRGYVSADGTWVIENERSASPIQVTDIACYREDNQCQLATAELFMGDVALSRCGTGLAGPTCHGVPG
jgi:hypothetical protein